MFPGGKGGRCAGLTTMPLSCADCHVIWELQPPGTLRACNGIALPLPLLQDARSDYQDKINNIYMLITLKYYLF
jgi:hypothetical protein